MGVEPHPDQEGSVVIRPGDEWPRAVSDGLDLPCSDCGNVPAFDYRVTDDFWRKYVPEKPTRLSVVCLPCLDSRCGGAGLSDALLEVQWTGTAHTVVLQPVARYIYAVAEFDRSGLGAF